MTPLGGIVAPIATPTDQTGAFRSEVMVDLVDHLVEDLDGLFVRGSSGEFAALRDDDAREVVRTVVEAVGGRRPVLVGVGDTSTPRTLDRLHALGETGADYVAVTTTYYYPATDAELIGHFTAVAERSALPVILYQIPQNTYNRLSTAAVTELASHQNIAGIKDSSGDFFSFQEILAARPGGFAVFQGREQLAASSLLAGADGVISSLANIAPALLGRLRDAAVAGDADEARSLQQEVTELARLFEEGYWLAALKAALEEMGFAVGPPVPPASQASPQARARIRKRLEVAGLVPVGEESA